MKSSNLNQNKIQIPRKLHKLKHVFLFLIGDNGAILMYARDNVLEMRMYFPDTSEKYMKQFTEIVSSDPKVPIHVILETLDQTYHIQSLPAVSSLGIHHLVKKRLERDFPSDSLKGSLFISRNKHGRKDWNFNFISAPTNTEPFSSWFDTIMHLPNYVGAVSLLPVESEILFKKINKLIYKNAKSPYTWQILVMHTKLGGIRQIVYKDGRIILTRLISDDQQADDEVAAGQFEQEIQNTIQYLKRNSPLNQTNDDNTKVEVFIICGRRIKKPLLSNRDFYIYTPYELAFSLGYENAVLPGDNFSDVIFAMNLTKAKFILPLYTHHTKLLRILNIASRSLKLVTVTTLAICICIMIYNLINIYPLGKKIDIHKAELDQINAAIQKRKDESGINEYEIQRMKEMNDLYTTLTANNISPLDILTRFKKTMAQDANIKSINWTTDKIGSSSNPTSSSRSSNYIYNMSNFTQTTPSDKNKLNTNVVFNLEFTNIGVSYQELFRNFDNFIARIEAEFSEYDIDYTRINQNISFQDRRQEIPVNITLRGPKS